MIKYFVLIDKPTKKIPLSIDTVIDAKSLEHTIFNKFGLLVIYNKELQLAFR